MQIHNFSLKQSILDYNWGGGTGRQGDLGLGTNGSGHPDWTFAASVPNNPELKKLDMDQRTRRHSIRRA
ncbi:hypothetical protein LJR289_005585 [Pseudoduganella sp. LjRoot289]|uniref:hypothetical protein n=1 Tax=Pseudoduganella sp. LjRoot289 TaxID=3342314 RepID=UPI003ECC4F34